MWSAPKHEDPQRPKVTLSVCTPDPLGVMAMINGQYTGKVYKSPAEVSDEERKEAWNAATVSRLSETPLEWIQLSFLFENVTRAFTHQLVRTRMATYAQESLRFAVKEDLGDAVKLPPSLAGSMSLPEYRAMLESEQPLVYEDITDAQKWRLTWDKAIEQLSDAYTDLVNSGMPAEDARGLLPTNILTRIHVRIDMKSLLGLAGMRLCTQAQFEWREVFARVSEALREYVGPDHPDRWQYEMMASRFRPVCFAANRCTMKAKSDRHCSIREQVDAYEYSGVPSEFWEDDPSVWDFPDTLKPIRPEQWLADPTAARVSQ
jgi:flavin-dependent thymidylate synthase